MPAITWDSKLAAAVGGASARKLHDAFGFETVGDLLRHYPRTYFAMGDTTGMDQLPAGEFVTVNAKVRSAEVRPYQDRRTGRTAYRVEAVVSTGDVELSLTFFDKHKKRAEWHKHRLPPGAQGLFSGKVDRFRNRMQLVHPRCEIIDASGDDAEDVAAAKLEELVRFRPIYPATQKVQSWDLEEAVKIVLDLLEDPPEVLPPEAWEPRGLVSSTTALHWIHRPDDWQQARAAERTLRFAEAFTTQVVLAQRRRATAASPATPRAGRAGGLLDRFDRTLPFELTAGQREVGEQVFTDLAAAHPMHRLLQGEVGSGKTVVALRAMLRVVDSGGQAALLAPTEVLAQQHHRSITAMLGDLAAGGMLGGAEDGTQVALLTGSMGAAARKRALLDAASGTAGIMVGTHALLEESVQFADLGLVVVDEQHRFGVEQRAALSAKAGQTPPHVLVMTATPIPRTVAMTVFGDLETSTLTELPAGRAPIQTNVVPTKARPQWLERAWARVREEVERGHQVYVVCPRIGGEVARAGEDVVDLAAWKRQHGRGRAEPQREPGQQREPEPAAVEELTPALASGVLEGLRVEMLHGRMPPDRKDEVMRGFARGDIDVLVSTTVIEVGVDVANATLMVVMDADRFGVSQLHQLRGRVGRGGEPGLCLLVTGADADTPALHRLTAVAATTDGFELSQLDLEQRREGDVLGAAQSGSRKNLRFLSVLHHEDVIRDARVAAEQLVADDPELTRHPGVAEEVRRLVDSEQADYLEKA
jgi:ATP-dependent DNA helicase RecG